MEFSSLFLRIFCICVLDDFRQSYETDYGSFQMNFISVAVFHFRLE